MLFYARFGQHSNKPDAFKEQLEPHRSYLRENSDKILMSASILLHPESDATGHIWLIEASSWDEAERVCREDPFWGAGLRTEFELYYLKKALLDITATI